MTLVITRTVSFFAIFGFAAAAVNSTRNHTARFATSNVTELTVQLDVPGRITWYSNSGESVRFVTTAHGETISEVETIQVTLLESEDSPVLTLQVYIAPTSTSPGAASTRNTANIAALTACCLLAWLVFFRGTFANVLLIAVVSLMLGGMWYTDAQSSSPTVNVDIHIPRDFIFKHVNLTAPMGSIQVDQGLLESAAPLHCLSGRTSEVCPMCCSGNGRCFNGECQCSVGYRNGTSDCANKSETTLRLFINPNDPVIMAADTPEGDELYMIGEKDSNGQPVEINRFEVKDSEGNITYAELDENGTVASAVDSSGMILNFVWDSNYTSVHVSLVLPNSSQQITINLDLTENITNTTLELDGEIVERRSVPDAHPRQRKQFHAKRRPSEKQSLRRRKSKGKRQTSSNAARVSVNVLSCGGPETDAIVQAYATVEEMTTIYNGVPSSMPGLYYIIIPTKAASTIGENIGQVCSKVEMILDKACGWYDKVKKVVDRVSIFSRKKHTADQRICFILASGLKLIPHLRLIPIYKFCRKALQGANFYCDKINAPIVEGVIDKKRSELICELITDYADNAIDLFRNTEIYLMPYAVFPAGHTVFALSQRLTLSPGSSDVSTVFTINDNSGLQITRLTVFPEDPAPHQSYTVTVEYECYTPSTHTSMSIVGTDSYTKSISCMGGPTCVLNVPGAAALVRDTVTVIITNPASAQSISRHVIIIF